MTAMINELLQRADRAIAESERLMDQLLKSRWEAERLDGRLHVLHQLRIEDNRRAGRLRQFTR